MGSGPSAATNNTTNSFSTDYAEAAEVYAQVYREQNNFDIIRDLAIPAVQAAANISILQYQKSQYDDIEQRRVGYLESAVDQWCDRINDLLVDIEAATDDVPEPALFQPVSPSGEQYQTVSDNLEIARSTEAYICYLNETHQEQDLIRQVLLNPDYYKVNEVTWVSIGSLIDGEIPESLIVETQTRAKEKACQNGRIGRSSRQTARDLGLIDYRVRKAGRAEAREERASQNRDVTPISKQADLREMMVTPQQRIGFAIQQGQLLQNSLQNAHNACARKAPFLQAQVQVALQKATNEMNLLAGRSSLVNAFVPDFASVLNPQITAVTNGLGGLFGGSGNNSISNLGRNSGTNDFQGLTPEGAGSIYGGFPNQK